MIFDVEADGLLDEATTIHVLAYKSGTSYKYTHDYDEMRSILTSQKVLIGHNIVRYDIPLLEKLLNIKINARLIDTLAMSWYLFHKRNQHGLEGFGEEYGVPKPKIGDWKNLSPEQYAHRCVEDVKINSRLWGDLKNKLLSIYLDKKSADRLISYLTFKMECAREQERSGWKLNTHKANTHFYELLFDQEDKLQALKKVMPERALFKKQTRPAKPYKKDGTYSVHGAKWFALLAENNLPKDYDDEIKVLSGYEEPNPGSHEQVKDWLFSLGWDPAEYKYVREDDGSERTIPQVRVDGESGKELCPSVLLLAEKHPAIRELEGLSVIQHRLGILKGFLDAERDGWLKAEIAGLTNTLRFKHKTIVNLPGVNKPYGKEVRGCLEAPEGYVLCGSDMVSLEETTKKHYMYPHDPAFVEEMSRPGFDAHLDLAKYAGAIKQKEIDCYLTGVDGYSYVKAIRGGYKVANYACVYGVGAPKLARTTGLSVKEAGKLIEAYWQRNWSVRKVSEELYVKEVGGEKWLLNPVSNLFYSLRYEKDRFSTLNQGTGVYCFDSWIREFRSRRSQLTSQFHDEIISCIKQGYEAKYEALLKDAIRVVNNKLKLNVLLDVDVKFGQTYAEIH